MNQISFKNSSMNNSITKMNESANNTKPPSSGTKQLNKIESKAPFYPASTHLSNMSLKKSIAENNAVLTDSEKASLYSTWTPLSDEKSNQKLFEERKQLFTKWFETWSESQRKLVIEDMLHHCKPKQLFFTREVLNKISPVYHIDFTRVLPRVISLYIFSFLDPRSLCRSSQVSWYWKMLSESDQLWMPKCLRFSWNLNYIPSSFENGIWKQFYIENIKALQYIPLKSNTSMITDRSELLSLNELSNGKFGFNSFARGSQKSNRQFKSATGPLKHPPWRGNSFNPNHLHRYNYLDNDEANDKRSEKIIKNLDSSMKHQSTVKQATSNLKINKSEHYSNQKIIENLIEKGQTLLNEINLQDFKNNQQNTESENNRKTPDLFSVIKPVSNSSILKDQSLSSLLTNNSNNKKNAWSQLDPSVTDS